VISEIGTAGKAWSPASVPIRAHGCPQSMRGTATLSLGLRQSDPSASVPPPIETTGTPALYSLPLLLSNNHRIQNHRLCDSERPVCALHSFRRTSPPLAHLTRLRNPRAAIRELRHILCAIPTLKRRRYILLLVFNREQRTSRSPRTLTANTDSSSAPPERIAKEIGHLILL
jgi:hypothetical protein